MEVDARMHLGGTAHVIVDGLNELRRLAATWDTDFKIAIVSCELCVKSVDPHHVEENAPIDRYSWSRDAIVNLKEAGWFFDPTPAYNCWRFKP